MPAHILPDTRELSRLARAAAETIHQRSCSEDELDDVWSEIFSFIRNRLDIYLNANCRELIRSRAELMLEHDKNLNHPHPRPQAEEHEPVERHQGECGEVVQALPGGDESDD